MLEDYVGPETFRKGLHAYLSNHAYSNARGAHLWDAINTAAEAEGLGLGVSVVPLMEAWIKQTGYPVLTADIARAAESDGSRRSRSPASCTTTCSARLRTRRSGRCPSR